MSNLEVKLTDSFAKQTVRMPSTYVDGIVFNLVSVTNDAFNGYEYLQLGTREFPNKPMSASVLTRNVFGRLVASDGTVATKAVVIRPEGTFVEAYKKALAEAYAAHTSIEPMTYLELAQTLSKSLPSGPIKISTRHYLNAYGKDVEIRDFNLVVSTKKK